MAKKKTLSNLLAAQKGGGAFGPIGNRSAGERIRDRITEDDPRWNPKTMGNLRGRVGAKRRR